jgi:hypothetical protein
MRGWWWAALLALPFVGVALLGHVLVPRWGDALARRLKAASALVPASSSAPAGDTRVDPGDIVSITVPDLDAGVIEDAGAAREAGARRGSVASRDAGSGALSVFVPAAAVQRAIDDGGKHIRGRTVRGPDGKPVGVRLTGVSGAKLGLQDGDIVVAVEGQATPDDDRATDVALSAIARGANRLHATVMRGDVPIQVTLDLPLAPEADAKGKGSPKAAPSSSAH